MSNIIIIRITLQLWAILAICAYSIMSYADGESGQSKWNHYADMNKNQLKQELQFFPHRASTHNNQILPVDSFQKASVCSACHQEIYQQWRSSMMSYSWDDPIYRALLKLASEKTQGKIDNFCTGCHTPIGLTTGLINSQVVQTINSNDSGQCSMPGVDCEACHNMTGHTGIDNGAYILSASLGNQPTKYGPRNDAKSSYHNSVYSPMHTQSKFCGTCHNVTHPFNHVPIERTYDEWLESPYATANIGCQDCHMSTAKGKAAIMGPTRENIASHWFSGANTTILKYFGAEKSADLAKKMLQSAARLEFVNTPKFLKPGRPASIQLKVENIGAGHKLPTGFPEGREIWVDFRVSDITNSEIYRLGKIRKGKTEPGTKNFKVLLGDDDGNIVDLEIWNVTHVISDNRIMPKGYNIVTFEFILPENSLGPYTISADLNYWPFPQALVDILLGNNQLTVDIVKMTSASLTIPSSIVSAFNND